MTGRVKVYVADRGFGWITGDDGRSYFWHGDDQVDDYELLTGDAVTFEAVVPQPAKGPRARAVALVPAS